MLEYELPMATKIFGLEDIDDTRMMCQIVDVNIQDNVHAIIEPYEELFDSPEFHFSDKVGTLWGINWSIFKERRSQAPVNIPLSIDSFMQIRGTKYEKYLDSNHKLTPDPNEVSYAEPCGIEIDLAENHCDLNFKYYDTVDHASVNRMINCYAHAAEDGVLDAYWCLGSVLNELRQDSWHWDSDIHYDWDEKYGLNYFYWTEGIMKGHLASIPTLCRHLFDEKHQLEAFQIAYIGAQKGELFSMWNLALHYLYGYFVDKSVDKAVELYEKILQTSKTKEGKKFIEENYYPFRQKEVRHLLFCVRKNLKLIRSDSDGWEKYFDAELKDRYESAREQLFELSIWNAEDKKDNFKKQLREMMRGTILYDLL